MPEKEQSVTWVIAMLMVVIAAFGWAFMAAGYAHHEEGWRSGGVQSNDRRTTPHREIFFWGSLNASVDFVGNAFQQIPNCVSVVRFTFTNRIWLPIVVAVLEILAVCGGYAMKQLEQSLNKPPGQGRPGQR